MMLGPIFFAQPLALTGLLLLPVIWLVLRATPPQPRRAQLPSLSLLADPVEVEETPATTPWWLLLLRLGAVALIVTGIAEPRLSPAADTEAAGSGPFVLAVDDSWTQATNWQEVQRSGLAALDALPTDRAVHLLTTAPTRRGNALSDRLSPADAAARLRAMSPAAWLPDYDAAANAVRDSGLADGTTLWLSDGLARDGLDTLAGMMASRGAVDVLANPPAATVSMSGVALGAAGLDVSLQRALTDGGLDVSVSARTSNGRALATAQTRFEDGSHEAVVRFELPDAVSSRIERFTLTGANTAGTVWLWDPALRSRQVGLVETGGVDQPLLSDAYYLRKALGPFATLREATLDALLENPPETLLLTDTGRLPDTEADALRSWVEAGGTLVRFAGPRLAAQSDTLTPVPLRRASRELGGALSWGEPQKLAPFPRTSPFADLRVPDDVRVRRQVLAQPIADLAARTWAELEDGTPLVTAAPLGSGTIVLFHVTAGPDWSDLPLSGVFVDMLQRVSSIGAGRSVTGTPDDTLLLPAQVLDGYGELTTPPVDAEGIEGTSFAETRPGPTHPPGLYEGANLARTLNAGAGLQPRIVESWPAGLNVVVSGKSLQRDLAGLLIGTALFLFALDLLVALAIAGRLRLPGFLRPARRTGAATTALIVFALALPMTGGDGNAHAQTPDEIIAAEAALNLRFAYIETGDPALDARVRAGLESLSLALYRKTTVEPAEPHAVSPSSPNLALYPMIYLALADTPRAFTDEDLQSLNAYMRSGGALVIDTRRGSSPAVTSGADPVLADVLAGLDAPPLARVGSDHVLNRTFYLIDDFTGRYPGRPLWAEPSSGTGAVISGMRGDGVASLFVTDADLAGAWARDARGRPLLSVDGGEQNREKATRFGVNLVMYVSDRKLQGRSGSSACAAGAVGRSGAGRCAPARRSARHPRPDPHARTGDAPMTEAWRLTLEPHLGWLTLAALATLSIIGLAIYLLRGGRASILRVVLFVLAAGALLNPNIIRENRDPLKSQVALILDTSASMEMAGRSDTARAVFDDLRTRLEADGAFEVRTGEVGSSGNGTRLAPGIDAVISDIPSDRLGGVVVVTDGQIHDE